MKVLVLYRPLSEHRAAVEEFLRQYQSLHSGPELEVVDIDSRAGAATAQTYDLVRYPAIMVLRDDGSVIQSWLGEDELPRLDDVQHFAQSAI